MASEEYTYIPVSKGFRVKFYDSFSKRSGAITRFTKKIYDYAGEFIEENGEAMKLKYNDLIIVVDNGVLVNLYRKY